MIIDSHCHLTYEPMSNALNETIDRANKDGIKYILTISTEDKSFEQILKIVNNYKSVYGTYGIHPHEAKLHQHIQSIDIINKNNLVNFASNFLFFIQSNFEPNAITNKNGIKKGIIN